jgi:hypothetical protein
MLIEFEDAAERAVQLKYMRLVEHHVYAGIGDIRVMAIADEDMERSDAKTSRCTSCASAAARGHRGSRRAPLASASITRATASSTT